MRAHPRKRDTCDRYVRGSRSLRNAKLRPLGWRIAGCWSLRSSGTWAGLGAVPFALGLHGKRARDKPASQGGARLRGLVQRTRCSRSGAGDRGPARLYRGVRGRGTRDAAAIDACQPGLVMRRIADLRPWGRRDQPRGCPYVIAAGSTPRALGRAGSSDETLAGLEASAGFDDDLAGETTQVSNPLRGLPTQIRTPERVIGPPGSARSPWNSCHGPAGPPWSRKAPSGRRPGQPGGWGRYLREPGGQRFTVRAGGLGGSRWSGLPAGSRDGSGGWFLSWGWFVADRGFSEWSWRAGWWLIAATVPVHDSGPATRGNRVAGPLRTGRQAVVDVPLALGLLPWAAVAVGGWGFSPGPWRACRRGLPVPRRPYGGAARAPGTTSRRPAGWPR